MSDNEYTTSIYPNPDGTFQGRLFCNGYSVADTAKYYIKTQAERAVEVLREQWEKGEIE